MQKNVFARTAVPFQSPFEALRAAPGDEQWTALRDRHPERPVSLCDDWNSALLRAVEVARP